MGHDDRRPLLAAPSELDSPSMAAPTILLVEDHQDTREMYQTLLEQAGYTVVAIATPRTAVQRLELMKADLVIMDLGLRGEGFSVAAQIAALSPAPKLMAVTGRLRTGVPAENVFVEYLLKPVMPDDLLAAVRRVLAS